MSTIFFVLGFIFLIASGVIFEKSYQLWKDVKKTHVECKKLWEDLQKARRKVNGE